MFNFRSPWNRIKPFPFLAVIFSVLFLGQGSFAQTAPQVLPYIVTTIAGGAASSPASGTACPVSGHTSTDSFGDGCLATEVVLKAPRFVTQDKLGNIFLSDSGNGLVRRIDVTTGIITRVAGGASQSPTTGAVCPSGSSTSINTDGDGCLGTDVKLGQPHGLAFTPNGDLYFADNSFDDVRKITATNGVIQTTGVISNVAGNTTYGYKTNVYSGTTVTTSINAATESYLNFPSGIAFDQAGNLYIADEGNQAIEAVNIGSTDTTIMGLPVPAGTIAKLVGYGSASAKSTTVECPNFVSTSSRGGCYSGKFTDGQPARTSTVDNPMDVAFDAAGNLYFPNEFNENVGTVTASGLISNYAGIQGTIGKSITRNVATSVPVGSDFSVAVDTSGNLYASDASAGVIWRVDAVSKQMYVVAGGAATTCAGTIGDGCPATQAIFSGKGIGSFASTASPGVAGVRMDAAGDLLVADGTAGPVAATANRIRKISNGTQFGTINASKPTQMLDVHFGVGDNPASNAYTLTTGAANFVLGSANCTLNSDQTQDCILSVQATPTVPGPFSATLTIASTKGLQSAPITLGGIFSPVAAASRTTVAVGTTNGCSGTTVAVGSQVVITSTTSGTGGTPTGTITFFNGTTQIGTSQTLNSAGQASITTSFPTAGTESITAIYNGDSFFLSSTAAASTLTVAVPTFSTTLNSAQSSTIAAGQSAIYTLMVAGNVYTGNINFSCSGLPSGSSCVFNPSTLAETGCSSSQTVGLTIQTSQPTPVKQSSFASSPFGQGPWAALGMLPGLALAFLITLRRRRNPSMRYGQIWLAAALLFVALGASACGNGTQSTPGTPAGTSTITVTAADAGGNSAPLKVTLTVH